MKTILNVIWLVLCGIWMSIAWALAGLLCFVLFFLVITIPFGIAAFRIANYVLWPFGRTIAPREGGMGFGALIGNIIWAILFGWELALGHLIAGVLLCVYPYFVESVLLQVLIGAVLLAVPFFVEY